MPGIEVSFSQVAQAVAGMPGVSLPEGMSPGLEAEASFQPENVVYANGAHAAEVEIDPDTGRIRLLRYVVVHDSGRLINPMIVDGQGAGRRRQRAWQCLVRGDDVRRRRDAAFD